MSAPSQPQTALHSSASETQPSFAASRLRSPSQTSNNPRRAFSSRISTFQRCARHDSNQVLHPRRLRCSRTVLNRPLLLQAFSPSQRCAYTRSARRGFYMSMRHVSIMMATRLMPHLSRWSLHSKTRPFQRPRTMRRQAIRHARGKSAFHYLSNASRSRTRLASSTERRFSRTPPHLKSRCWRHLYRSYLMNRVIFFPQVSLASLIRTRCLGVFPRRKSITKRVVVKYIHFERESPKTEVI